MRDLLLPTTDAAVALQAAIVFPLLALAIYAVRRDREWRLLLIGIAVVAVAFFALRAAH